MNIPNLIIDYLKLHGIAEVEAFGIFSLVNSKAEVSGDGKAILPPSKKIVLAFDYEIGDKGLLQFIANQENLALDDVQEQLENQTGYWKNKIQQGESFEMWPLGSIKISGESVVLDGARLEKEAPDFYGLEEISLSEIQRLKKSNSNYKISKVIWPILALASLGLGALAYFNQELIFGRKSFANSELKPVEKKAVPPKPITDTIKTDSLKNDSATIAPKPSKKWTGTKTHYKKSKWKQKKLRNH